jgi:hypothetical protein
MRSEMVQFRDVRELSTLERYSQNYLDHNARPRLTFVMNVVDKGDAFANIRLGNSFTAQISKAILPGGVQGWRGSARALAMAYTEAENELSVMAESYEL